MVRKSSREKAAKDLRQAMTLAAVLMEDEADALMDSRTEVPKEMRQTVARHRARIVGSLPPEAALREALDRLLV